MDTAPLSRSPSNSERERREKRREKREREEHPVKKRGGRKRNITEKKMKKNIKKIYSQNKISSVRSNQQSVSNLESRTIMRRNVCIPDLCRNRERL